MVLIQKASKLGYKHYTEFTVKELDNVSLGNSNKQIEYYFIQKWLREVHGIDVITLPTSYSAKYIFRLYQKGTICKNQIYGDYRRKDYANYEQALEKGLYQALKLIKNE